MLAAQAVPVGGDLVPLGDEAVALGGDRGRLLPGALQLGQRDDLGGGGIAAPDAVPPSGPTPFGTAAPPRWAAPFGWPAPFGWTAAPLEGGRAIG